MKVLDACGILHSDLDYSAEEYYITNSVVAEIINETAKAMVDNGIRRGNLKIRDPKIESVKKAKDAAKKTGDLPKLSDADLDVIALALESGAEIVSDDYGIQNVAASLRLKYQTTAKEGIQKEYVWEKVCPGCGLKHSLNFDRCEVCDTKLKRVGKKAVKE
jgi:UPF0271 protein